MKLKSYLCAVAAAALIGGSASSQAAAIMDGWQFDMTNAGIASLTTDIGHFNLSSGSANVQQEVNGLGNPFNGASFSEFGAIYSLSYTKENCVGACDFSPGGLPPTFNGGANYGVRLQFKNLSGSVLSYNALTGEIKYNFTQGSGSVTLEGTDDGGSTWTVLANLFVKGGGGSLNDFFGGSGTNGDSTVDSMVLAAGYTPGLFKDSSGTALDAAVAGNDLYFGVRTNNEISQAASGPVQCSFDQSKTCMELLVTSNGSANLSIPEPSVVALMGIGLLGMGLAKRRRRKLA